MSTEGPLSRLMSLLGMADKLKPIPEVKRIAERPVSLNSACIGGDPLCPCQDGDACHYRDLPGSPAMPFKMTPRPEDMSDTGIHRLYGDLLRREPSARQYDLRTDYASYRPKAERWICVDELTYDGAPDSEAPCTFIGRGASEKAARMDLLAQFAEFDNPEPAPKPRVQRMVNHVADQPPEISEGHIEDWERDE